MSASAPTRPDERYKREQCFRCPERARISWGRAVRRRVRGTDLSLSRSGQRHIDAPWPRKFNQGPYESRIAELHGSSLVPPSHYLNGKENPLPSSRSDPSLPFKGDGRAHVTPVAMDPD